MKENRRYLQNYSHVIPYFFSDQAILPENGYAEIVGRIKDMVIRGGENIYPREIEETLHKHEKIIEAQVVGVPDHRMGEELCAWIRTQEGETLTQEEVKEFCKLEVKIIFFTVFATLRMIRRLSFQLAHFKIPRYVLFVDSFPITVTGKIQKFIMREQSIEKLNIGQEKNSY